MQEQLRIVAREAIGFMPDDEGLALYEAGLWGAKVGPLLEIGSYCGKSAVYLGAAAQELGSVLYSIDHHRGSEEQQPGEEYHDPRLIDSETGRIDTLPVFRKTIAQAGLEQHVIALVGESATIARHWSTPLGLVFIDGGHSDEAVQSDYDGWAPSILPGGLLAIHDVFENPADGGQAPFRVYKRAIADGIFKEISRAGSLRVLERLHRAS
jgi:predicted O-methyltransferase YrrM